MTAEKSRTAYVLFIAFNVVLSVGIIIGRLI
jgi:hypothetical protein